MMPLSLYLNIRVRRASWTRSMAKCQSIKKVYVPHAEQGRTGGTRGQCTGQDYVRFGLCIPSTPSVMHVIYV